MTNLIDKIRKLFLQQKETERTEKGKHMNQQPETQPSGTPMLLDEQSIVRLMQLVEQTEEGHYSCAETFDLLDEYVDLVVDNKGAELLMPIVKRHLDHCPGCQDQYEILLNILQSNV